MTITLNDAQRRAYDLVMDGKNVLITGVAGTGKSTLLNEIKDELRRHNRRIAVTGTTGIAALNVGGQTIHSFAGIGLGDKSLDHYAASITIKAKHRIMDAETLVIDEVSMLDAKVFDLLDGLFRRVRGVPKKFGGVQIVAFGDFLQLWPIGKRGEPAKFAFEAQAWNECAFTPVMLTETYRQTDQEFVDALNKIRIGAPDDSVSELLAKCENRPDRFPVGIYPTKLFATNEEADMMNARRLAGIEETEESFEAEVNGDEWRADNFFKSSKARRTFTVKKGAQVMCIVNKYSEDGIVNGSIGVVREISDDSIEVEFECGFVSIEKNEWEIHDEDGRRVLSVWQFPLVLGWAITIHKSQGMTITYLFCDLSKVFAYGQAYVALSRARSLEGLVVQGYNPAKVRADPKALEFYRNLAE